MLLTPGVRLGPYEVVAPLGAGGMGEVYRAKDSRLGRDVAIKVLVADATADGERLQRFELEARAAAALNHPNILAVHDVGRHDGAPYIVCEVLEGESLRERLTRSSLPLRKAIDYAVQLAHGLTAAHGRGIVHRDLKPENVFITTDDQVKILDFGLAKLTEAEPAHAAVSALPTSPPHTVPGIVLGTVGYMAPEQVRGLAVDHRADIFAFGAILYELLGARRAFAGETPADTMTAILRENPPDVALTDRQIPPALRRIIDRCLEENPAGRFQTASDLAFALESWASQSDTPTPVGIRDRNGSWRGTARVAWISASAMAVLALSAVGIAAWLWTSRNPAPVKMTFEIPNELSPSPLHLALSPDGTQLAYVVATESRGVLRVQRLDDGIGREFPVVGPVNAPFWSPDGKSIGFFATGKLNRIDVSTGYVQTLCDAPSARGGNWNRSGTILFAGRTTGPLFTVPASGGVPVQVTHLDASRGDIAHRYPRFLPDGNHFLFFVLTSKSETAGLYLGALDSRETQRIVASDAMGIFAPPRHLLFVRGDTLLAQRFNTRRVVLEGDPVPVVQGVGVNMDTSLTGIAVSDTGILAYFAGNNPAFNRVLRWVDRTGTSAGDLGAAGARDNVRLSAAGDRIIETRRVGLTTDLWVTDLLRGNSSSKVTTHPAIDDNGIWSPDGRDIIFASARDGLLDLYIKNNAAEIGEERLLLKTDASKYPSDWSRDGKHLLYTELRNSNDVWVLPLEGERKPFALLQSAYSENRARFSPDGRWFAYVSDETGQSEIYVQSFPPSGRKYKISTAGGFEPQWRGDGRELFYFVSGGMWAVDVASTDATRFTAGIPRKLYDIVLRTNSLGTRYEVSRDGQKFLVNIDSAGQGTGGAIRVLVNWTQGLDATGQ